jgi:A/G-specific adenine glycosylase
MDFAQKLINWYQQNKRDLPWRNTKNPYQIWLSEIILQQTRVAQGTSYYLKFINAFPTIDMLAAAKEDQVLKLWQGLGYYSRARNLHFTAKEIVAKHHGKFPSSYEKILELKGIGSYTAAALASFAFNKPYAVVDGNVYRVLSRIFGIETSIDSSTGKKEFLDLAQTLLDTANPATYNQAIMEFGATQCVPKNPDCSTCCFNNKCEALRLKKVAALPFKEKKTKQRKRYFNYLLLESGAYTYVKQRGAGDIWQGLYEFPLIETDTQLSEKDLMQSEAWIKLLGKTKLHFKYISPFRKHLLSHQILQLRFIKIELPKSMEINIGKSYKKTKTQNLNQFAWPRIIDKELENLI